ncbi:MAG: PUA domain-containing protein, partial [Candidatus Hodarchaeota archaeon]
TYPAAHYDIPVTGDWNDIEKKHLTEDLEDFLSKYDTSIPLVGYLNDTEREIFEKVCSAQNREMYITKESLEKLTSREGLQQFSSLLQEAFSDINLVPRISNKIAFFRTVADFQFGKGIGSILIPEDVKISGRKELGMRIAFEGKHFLSFRSETGFLTISLLAAERLLGHTNNVVTFDGRKISGSTIFAKAISKADPEIRPNDEVLIIDEEGNLIATGTSFLSGDLLVKMKRGKGVNIREKV